MSWLTNLRGVVGTLFKIGKADFDSTAVTSARTLALRDIAGTVALLSDITTYGRSLQEITPTSEGQTSFTVPGGYAVGSTDFLVNGVQLRTTEFTATDGTTVTISAGLSTTDLLTAIRWGNGGATSFTTTAASATAGQTAFTVPTYPTGLSAMAVYRNGIRLTPTTDFVETNSTTVTLTSAADLNDDMLFISGTPVGSFGTMATQNASSVAITGGTIDGATVGATTASTIKATTLQTTGSAGIGAIPGSQAGTSLRISAPITGNVSSMPVRIDGTIQNDVTTDVSMYGTSANTVATSFTLSNLFHFRATQGTFGSGSVVTSQYGFVVSSTLTGATNNYGFYGAINSGSNRWNFFAFGTASNHFNGTTLIGTTTDNGIDKLQVNGHIALVTAGNGYKTKEGSNAKQGTAVLVAGTVTVSNTSVTANSRIFLTSNTDGGTPGFVRVSARTAGTSFTITSSSASDTSTIAYEIFEPA